jgi:hypothetical protein
MTITHYELVQLVLSGVVMEKVWTRVWFDSHHIRRWGYVWASAFIFLEAVAVIAAPAYMVLPVLGVSGGALVSGARRWRRVTISLALSGRDEHSVYRDAVGKILVHLRDQNSSAQVELDPLGLLGFREEATLGVGSVVYAVKNEEGAPRYIFLIDSVPEKHARDLVGWLAAQTGTRVLPR